MSQNAQNAQDELDNTKEIFLAEKAIIRDRLDESLKNVQRVRKEKEGLSETIKAMEVELKVKEKAEQELRSRLQSLEGALKKSKQDYKEEVIQRKRLEDERSSLFLQISDAEKQKEGLLQKIQDLQQECRYNLSRRKAPVADPPPSQAASHLSSTVPTPVALGSIFVSPSPPPDLSVSCINNSGQLADLTSMPCSQPHADTIDTSKHLSLPTIARVDLKKESTQKISR
jgi:hypothetical protein